MLKQLPAEIVDEILHKLPVKSLLRFKCVSKPWRCSISSKGFIREHLKKSTSGTDFSHHNLICIKYRSIWSCCIGSLLNNDYYNNYIDDEPNPFLCCSVLSIPIPIPDLNGISIWGSCNGLILIQINDWKLYLWNPSIRKAKEIVHPQETIPLLSDWENVDFWYAFGYIESTDDYMVACIISSRESRRQLSTYVYSSTTDSWKTIPNWEHGLIVDCCATFVNGSLYWLIEEIDIEENDCFIPHENIVSLDLVEEKYQIVPPPPRLSDYVRPVLLGDTGGYLTLVCSDNTVMHIWVMEKESWSKIGELWLPVPHLLWLKKNGVILVADDSDLVIYYGEEELHRSRVDMLSRKNGSIVYVESLVSPFSDNEQLNDQ